MSVDRETLEKTVNLNATAPKMDDVWMEYVETVFACVTRVELVYIINFNCNRREDISALPEIDENVATKLLFEKVKTSVNYHHKLKFIMSKKTLNCDDLAIIFS